MKVILFPYFFIASLLWLISILSKALPTKDSDTYYLPKSELILKHKPQNKIFLLYLFAFLFGLSLSNSLIPLFMLPGLLYSFILRENRRFIVRHALLLIKKLIKFSHSKKASSYPYGTVCLRILRIPEATHNSLKNGGVPIKLRSEHK